MSHLPHQRLHPSRSERIFVARWGAVVLLLIGALLAGLGSCSTGAGPPGPAADAAGTIERSAPTSFSSEPTSSETTSSETTGSEPTSSEPTGSETTGSEATGRESTGREMTGSESSDSPAGRATPDPPEKPSSSDTAAPTTRSSIVVPSFEPPAVAGPILPAAPPVSLAIPAIGVQAPVSDLALLDDGSIEVPPMEETNETGWYTGSPTPGEQGPSVILGHVDSARNGPSVFYRLGELKPDDEISVTRDDGTVAVFRIDGVREYGKNEFPTEVVYGNLDHAGLRLITCGGTFDPNVGHYESNVIAFASLIGSHRSDGR